MTVAGSPVAVGDILAGKFRVEKVLGIGGMGVVVAATHLELEQRVALKFMLAQLVSTPQATERFLREARAAGRLRSEHICRVHDVGKLDDGAPYIMMELLDGEDLSQVLDRREKLPVQEAVDLMLQAIEGIAEAHAHGIVHRDLKPGNLFLTTRNDGSPLVKVLDFGISKLGTNSGATATGQMMGSPAYMAPEQMHSSRDVDARADLWALGVILYQALSGRLPFDHETLPGLCLAVVNDEPARLGAGAIDAVVARCLAKQRQARYADVGALALALAEFGSTYASSVAMRVVKILRRVSGAQPTMVTDSPARDDATKQLGAAPPPPVEQRAKVSTLGASTGQSMAEPPAPVSRGKRQVVMASVAAVALAGLGIAIGLIGGRRNDVAKPAPASAPAVHADEVAAPEPPPPLSPDAAAMDFTVVVVPDAVHPPDAVAAVTSSSDTEPPLDAATADTAVPSARPGKRRPPQSASQPSGTVKPAPPSRHEVAEPTQPVRDPEPDSDRSIYRGTKATISTEYPTN